MSECKFTCNNCPQLVTRKSNYGEEGSLNAYCEEGRSIRLLELCTDLSKDIKSPSWCSKMESEKIKDKISKGEKLTDGEKRSVLMRHTPLVEWKDIEVNQIYHIPPLLGEKRRDILVTWRGEYSATFKDLTKSYKSTETMYPSTLIARFLVKHKIKNVKILEKA